MTDRARTSVPRRQRRCFRQAADGAVELRAVLASQGQANDAIDAGDALARDRAGETVELPIDGIDGGRNTG